MTATFPEHNAEIPTENMLSILNIDPGTMTDNGKLRELIQQIERAGAQVNSLFPSAHIITVESNTSQTEILSKLDGVTRIS